MRSPLDILPAETSARNQRRWLYANFDIIREALLHGYLRHPQAEFYPGGFEATSALGLVGEFSWFIPQPAAQLVFSFWVDLNSVTGVRRFLFRGQTSATAFAANIEIDASEKLRIIWTNDAGTAIVDVTTDAALPGSGLTHICGYIDIAAPAVYIYEDGTAKAHTAATLTADTHLFTGHARWGINGAPLTGASRESFIIQELFLHAQAATVPGNLPLLFRSASLPKDLGSLGEAPFDAVPAFYFTGLGDGFRNRGRAGQLFPYQNRSFPQTIMGT